MNECKPPDINQDIKFNTDLKSEHDVVFHFPWNMLQDKMCKKSCNCTTNRNQQSFVPFESECQNCLLEN